MTLNSSKVWQFTPETKHIKASITFGGVLIADLEPRVSKKRTNKIAAAIVDALNEKKFKP